jgi:hypothetical protein
LAWNSRRIGVLSISPSRSMKGAANQLPVPNSTDSMPISAHAARTASKGMSLRLSVIRPIFMARLGVGRFGRRHLAQFGGRQHWHLAADVNI